MNLLHSILRNSKALIKKCLILSLLLTFIPTVALATPRGKTPDFSPTIIDISDYTLKEEFTSDLDKNGKKEEVQLWYKPTDDTFAIFILVVRKDNKLYTTGKTILAPKDHCYIEELTISPEMKPLIRVSFPIGAHSEWLGIYSFRDNRLIEINNLFSDQPSIVFEDFDGNGMKDLTILYRDYDKNPVSDSIIKKYKYINGKFREVSDG